MIRIAMAIALVAATMSTVAAQERGGQEDHSFRLGKDAYFSGTTVDVAEPDIETLFAAGESVRLTVPVTGSAHLAGRALEIGGAVGRDLYAAGADLEITAPVAGSASLAGYDIDLRAAIGGNLRAAASSLSVDAPVAGTALLAAGTVEISGIIEGDVAIGAEELTFGPEARINGRLSLYGEDADEIVVPESVIPADRIERHAEMHAGMAQMPEASPAWWMIAGALVLGLLFVAILAAIVSALAPQGLEELREKTGDRPTRTLFMGFLALSTLLGSALVLALTLVGILLAPAILLAAVVLWILGYLIGVYLLGRLLLVRFGQLPPDTFPERVFTGLTGAVLIGLLALIPVAGYLAVLALTLVGIGAFTVGVFRPEFRP